MQYRIQFQFHRQTILLWSGTVNSMKKEWGTLKSFVLDKFMISFNKLSCTLRSKLLLKVQKPALEYGFVHMTKNNLKYFQRFIFELSLVFPLFCYCHFSLLPSVPTLRSKRSFVVILFLCRSRTFKNSSRSTSLTAAAFSANWTQKKWLKITFL